MPNVIVALELFWKIPALMGIPFWLGIIWRRANPISVWVSFISATVAFLACELGFIELPLAWEMAAYLSAGPHRWFNSRIAYETPAEGISRHIL